MMEAIRRPAAEAKLRLHRARADHGWFDVVIRTFKRFGEDDAGTLTAALTYYTFFSIFPLLLFSAALLGYLTLGDTELRQQIVEGGLRTIPILRDALTPEGLAIIVEMKGSIALTALILALYTGSGAVAALAHALNKINRITDGTSMVKRRLRSLLWLAVLGAGAIASLGVTTISGFAPGALAAVSSVIGGLVLSTALFATAFRVLPARDYAWREVLPGAIVAAVCFEILKVAGTAYLAQGEAARNETFGAFAAAAALLVASYLIARVTLLAAEVNAVLAERRTTRESLYDGKEGK